MALYEDYNLKSGLGDVNTATLSKTGLVKPDGTSINISADGTISVLSSLPVGTILPYGGTTAPTGFLLCNGGAISRTTYANLFSVIGTAYGAGDGNTTFNLPNCSTINLMKTNTVPSVGCKGNGKVLSVSDGAYNYGATTGSDTFDFYKNAYNKNVGASGLNGGGTGRTGYGIGLVSDASKSGIITDTGTMSAVSSRAIIKY